RHSKVRKPFKHHVNSLLESERFKNLDQAKKELTRQVLLGDDTYIGLAILSDASSWIKLTHTQMSYIVGDIRTFDKEKQISQRNALCRFIADNFEIWCRCTSLPDSRTGHKFVDDPRSIALRMFIDKNSTVRDIQGAFDRKVQGILKKESEQINSRLEELFSDLGLGPDEMND
ncbi:MAG: hypothetical protein AAF621_05935, partial [Pseudomonadota bacterium]